MNVIQIMRVEYNILGLLFWTCVYYARNIVYNHKQLLPSNMWLCTWILYWAILYWIIRIFLQINQEPTILHSYMRDALEWADPTFSLFIAIGYQVAAFFYIIFNQPYKTLFGELIDLITETIVMKLIPLYFVWHHSVIWINSIQSFLVLFAIYYAFIKSKSIDILQVYDYQSPQKYQF